MTKQEAQQMKAEDFQKLLEIVGDLSYPGYRACLCHLKGKSLQQCANSIGLSKSAVFRAVQNCSAKRYDKDLLRIFLLDGRGIIAPDPSRKE